MPDSPAETSRGSYADSLKSITLRVDYYEANQDKLSTKDSLAELMGFLQTIHHLEGGYKTVQQQIIAESPSDSKQLEKDELRQFLDHSTKLYMRTTKLIATAKIYCGITPSTSTPSGSSETSELAKQMLSLTKSLEKQQEVLVSLMEIQKEKNLPVEKPSSDVVEQSVKLEPLKVPQFSGSYEDWQSFQDLFNAVVHNNSSLTSVQKMHYLKNSLSGEAKLVINHLPMSDANYLVARKALEEKYEDTLSIVNAHIDVFLNQPAVQKPTASAIRKLQITSLSTLQALEALNVTARDPWLINLMLKKLDQETQMLWSRHNLGKIATWESFSSFLQERYKSLETYNNHSAKNPPNHESRIMRKTSAVTNVNNACQLCNRNGHKLFKCREFLKLSAAARVDTVQKLKICKNCLSESHSLNLCAYPSCRHCSQKHNRLLHDALASNVSQINPPHSANQLEPSSSTFISPLVPPNLSQVNASSQNRLALQASCHGVEQQSSVQGSGVLLVTAIVMLRDGDNNLQPCRALLDAGSHVHFMTTSLQQRLKLKPKSANFIVEGIGGAAHNVKKQVQALMEISYDGEQSLMSLDCLVIPKITGDQPSVSFDVSSVCIPAQFKLADPTWHQKGPIDLLIGGQYFWTFIRGEPYHLGPGLPVLMDSCFGWLMVGPYMSLLPQSMPTSIVATCGISTLESIDETLKTYFEVGAIPHKTSISAEAAEVEELFSSTTRRTDSGRYVVQLPLKENVDTLKNNRPNAVQQFYSLEGRLKRDPELKAQYNQTIKEYLDLGIVEVVPYNELQSNSYYFPHHCVVKEAAVSTKVRIVFNASSKSQSGVSLNDVLKTGPVVQPALIEVLWRFRQHPVALTCDIVKMYLQTLVHEPHRDFQRFIWRESPEGKLMDMRFRSVCFGVAPSPYLATRALNQVADDEGEQFKHAAQVIKKNFYVDDCLVSFPTEEKLIRVREELIEILKLAGMELSKFNSNVTQLSSGSSDLDVPIDDCTTKALGMIWSPQADTFQFKINLGSEIVTKRNILSVISRVFDPLGLIGPLDVRGKVIMQETWKLKLDWDTDIAAEYLDETGVPLRDRWINFITDLKQIEQLRIPRWVSNIQFPVNTELHGFGDACFYAYGAVVFIVTEDSVGNRSTQMMSSKSRVTPMKDGKRTMTIPKAELCGAVMALELTDALSTTLDLPDCHYWIDATCVLHQIHNPHGKREEFVRKRVSQILESSRAEQWRHVRSKENPADLISRGCTASELLNSAAWWEGPDWLSLPEEFWPRPFDQFALVNALPVIPEESYEYDDVCGYVIAKLKTFHRMRFVLARCMAIAKHWRNKLRPISRQTPRTTTYPTLRQLSTAENMIIRYEQMSKLQDCYTALANGSIESSIKLKSLRQLRPFLDDNGILRVGGRLQLLEECQDVKHPILMPKGDLEKAIMVDEHERLLHAGPQLLLSSIRQRFWPLSGRVIARKVVMDCVTCARANPRLETQLMGNLPVDRIVYQRVFKSVGIDFAGPFLIRKGVRRDSTAKAYAAVFVCMSVKAVYIDLVSSLTTDAFMACLRRFMARRGIPAKIYTDNGRTFLGASNEIKRLFDSQEFQETVHRATAERRIEWHFSPPHSPHHGGLWEAAVKSFKFHLKRIVGNTVLSFEELSTMLAEIEAVMNSRPLTPLSSDVEDLRVLTPGMFFLDGESPCELPEPNLSQEPVGLLRKYTLSQKLKQDLARQWKLDYLHNLQNRNKWSRLHKNLQCGDFVLIKKDMTPSMSWPIGRVVQLHPGRDGHVRVVKVKTGTGIYTRGISELAKLPIYEFEMEADQ